MSDTIAERELRGATLCQTLHWLAEGRIGAEPLARAYLDAIARANSRLNAYLPSPIDVIEQARASDVRRRADGMPIGRLDGVPVSVKDNIDVRGVPTRCGLPGRDAPASHDAAVVERLRGAGAVILGKTTLDEGVLGADGKNAHFGDAQNPWRPGFTPGGSSSGAAAAVAAGLCVAAIGSDSLGSSRIPASYCGVYALKPTAGEISTRGIWPAARRLDSIGLIARSVDDLTVMLHVLAGYDAADPRSRKRRVDLALPDWEPGKLRVGVLGDLAEWGVDADVAELFERALQTLQYELPRRERVDFADFPIAHARRAAFFLIEAEMLNTYADDVNRASPHLRKLLDYARGKSAADYAAADRVLDAAMLKARRLFSQVDVLVTPTTPQTAFAHSAPVPANQADFTCFANLAGCPALSIPMGVTATGLPAGLQLLGPPGSELRLLELAEVCAAALDATPAYPIEA
jgi:aspartyl-tRNA(Asn)/glutamyl-tRNA(Gln) amidotransferase subunit A